MRKVIIFIIIVVISIFFSLIITKGEETEMVFNEQDNSYDVYLLDISKENINTNNIFNYFEDVKILEIIPYINPLYKKVINISSYSFNTILSNKKNISLFINEYLNKLDEYHLKEEIINYRINGIKINKIKVYASNYSMNNIINNYNIRIIK